MIEVLLVSRIILLILFPFVMYHLYRMDIWQFDKTAAIFLYGLLGLDFMANSVRVITYLLGQ